MANLKRILLLRHGQSKGNVSLENYQYLPDYAMPLTELGIGQAKRAGEKIKEIVKNESIAAYVSPYKRTRQTFEEVKKSVFFDFIREDPRIREQEWTTLGESDRMGNKKKADDYGTFFYRFSQGESCADVFDRVSCFTRDLFEHANDSAAPENILIVGHGMTSRVILMKLLGLTVEEFEMLRNPKNGEFYTLERGANGLRLTEEPKKRERLERIYV